MSRNRGTDRSRWPPAVLVAAIVLIAILAGATGLLGPLKVATSRRALDSSAFGSRDMTRVLGRLGLVHSLPDDPSTLEPASFDQAFSLDELRPDELGEVLEIDQEWIDRGVPVISLLLDPEDLAELEANPLARGREWERRAHFAWVEGGRVRFASRVGCRLHGGGVWVTGDHGFRIYFRRTYGAEVLPATLFPTDGPRQAKRVVLRLDGGATHVRRRGTRSPRGDRPWYFTNAISNDLARRIGLHTVRTQPAAVFVNGEFKRVRGVIERIDTQFLQGHFGHRDFVMARTRFERYKSRRERELPASYAEFRKWAVGDDPISLEEVAARVDVDNLVRWSLLVQMAGVFDFTQGVALFDLRAVEPRWHWIPWDLNVSLGITQRPARDSSRLDQFGPFFTRPRSWSRDERTALVGRLLSSSAEFRSLYSTTFDEIYNHRLTPLWGRQTVARYRQVATAFGIDDRFLTFVEEFLHRRPARLRQQMRRHFGYGPSHTVRLELPPGVSASVDGFEVEGAFEGVYTEGSLLRLGVPEEARPTFPGWEVGSRRLPGPEAEIVVDGPLSIRVAMPPGS